MDARERFAVSSLLESVSREDFAIHLYNRQLHSDPFAEVPLTPLYYVLDEVYRIMPSPLVIADLMGIAEVELMHKRRFTRAAAQMNPAGDPVLKIVFPDDLFAGVTVPGVEPVVGMKTALRLAVTDIVQEQRAKLIYDYFARETTGWVRDLYEEIALQEAAHRRIFEHVLQEITGRSKALLRCPVCGKLLEFAPEEGAEGGCGYCLSKLVLRIEHDDFVLKLRNDRQQ